MVIHSTTLDTMEKVIAIYGGTKWEKIEGRFLLGQSEDYEINRTGGEKTHTLTTSEMPSHTHTYQKSNTSTNSHTLTVAQMPNHTHTYVYPLGTTNAAFGNEPNQYGLVMTGGHEDYLVTATGGNNGHSHGISLTETNSSVNGSGSAHNNMPPYKVVYIWERTA